MTRNALFALLPFIAACSGTSPVEQPEWSGEAVDSALIWSGFDHEWAYNHRLNRLGNWVGPMSCARGACSAEMVHAAASGVGSDTATWSATATAVRAPGVGFLAGSTAFAIDQAVAEGKYVEETRQVTVALDGLLADRSQYVVVLGGYDVFALADADMFQTLRIAVGDVSIDAEAGTATFPVTFGLQVDCDAFECDGTWDVGGKVDQSVLYGANVMWQVIAADDQIAVSQARVADGYAWQDETGAEIEREDFSVPTTVHGARHSGGQVYGSAVAGVQSIAIAIDHPNHFVQIATGVCDFAYDPTTGRADLRADLFFKQWSDAMLDKSVAATTPGEARTEATLAVVRFADAQVEPIDAHGAVTWNADGSTATGESAVDRQPVSWSAR